MLDRPSAGPQDVCRACRLAPPPFERAVSCGPYEGRLRDVLHALKYDGLRPAAGPLGRLLAGLIVRLAGDGPRQWLVVPVPLHRTKHSGRGFNQAGLLAAEAVASVRRLRTDIELTLAPAVLARVRATESQAGLTARQRRINLRGAFQVRDAGAVRGRHVLLIDDILTTGATARAASRVLLEAGAESVRVATLARARMHWISSRSWAAVHERDDLATPGSGAEAVHLQPATMNTQSQPFF